MKIAVGVSSRNACRLSTAIISVRPGTNSGFVVEYGVNKCESC
jgi:hypothetical protein